MANINISCIAIIGKQASNNPLYIKNFNPSHADLKYHYIAHTSCDVMEERAAMKAQDMYLGALFSMEDLSVYGYMTNTKIKFITVLTVPDVIIKDLDMKNVFRRIHVAYTNLTCNPFYEIDSQKMIKSKQFDSEIEAIGRGRALEGGNRNSVPANASSVLTPSQEHYLKKYLFGVLIKNELEILQRDPHQALPNLGGPFDPKDEHADSTTPFLRYLFESIVVPFPFLTSNNGELWPKLQLFMDEWAKIDDGGNGVEREEMLRRNRLKNKCEKTMVLMYSMSVKTVQQRAQEKEEELRKEKGLEGSLGGLQLSSTDAPTPPVSVTGPLTIIHGFRINVAGIRVVREKRHVREHEHAIFLVSSTFPDGMEYVVARRYTQFRQLYVSLREEFPQYEFPLPPASLSSKSGSSGVKAAREKDRVSLRGYLHNLAKISPDVVNSVFFVNFLTKDPATLTADETKDFKVRAALDESRKEQQAKFDKEVAKKVEELDKQLKQVKAELLQPNGVTRLFAAFREHEKVEDLPPLYQATFEWGCMDFASTLYHVFTASDDATLNFMQLKRTQMLMPYRAMWGILKVSNPVAIMKGIMDLFLAQPFGSRSLIQRIISVNIQEEITEYKKDVTQLEASINDPGLCEKIRNYVYAPKAVVEKIFSNVDLYDITDVNLVMDVLKSDQIQPLLQAGQIQRVFDAYQQLEMDDARKIRLAREQQAFANGEGDLSDQSDDESNGADTTSSSEAPRIFHSSKKGHIKANAISQMNLIRLLQQLLVTQLRIRDKERMMDLVFQGVTGEIFKELVSIFYQPLVQVYKAANVADSLMDVKDFVDELVKIVEQADVTDDGQSGKTPISTLYLNLVKKHLPSFYRFVHSVHKQNDGLFHDLLEWIESILTFLRTGYARTRINYKTEEEIRAAVDLDEFVKTNVDKSQWEALQKEAESLREYFVLVKDRKREEVRRMAGLDRGSSPTQSAREREVIANELRGMGMREEYVDELEMINYHNHEDEAEGALKVPQVPVIDNLKSPFVKVMDKTLFQSARE
ncbi:hypothetical protein BGZ80_008916 [Entomortierella chlamydospora]|uniref:Trafficking protein particle complex subunit 2-like protein n=1 Tax=Entomortierella chlamydospora TaxID=101097 RepID=A0A9P6N4F4_9FUNG|nr:hypothetical protein BGZ79_007888 [Entomortierella chlamydospora]KAG0023591.1 hypothetical protein BGZ80_008916 [Entomortierella chlamydospora]